jgi:hypothetical protein
MGADKNSFMRTWLMPQNHLQNVSLKAFQDHVVTGVLLTLGARLERLRKTDQNKVTRPLPDHPEP